MPDALRAHDAHVGALAELRVEGDLVPAWRERLARTCGDCHATLVGPSNDAWRAGGPVLAVESLAQSVQTLGRKAAVVETPVDRAAVYGELMATCATCHSWLGGGRSVE